MISKYLSLIDVVLLFENTVVPTKISSYTMMAYCRCNSLPTSSPQSSLSCVACTRFLNSCTRKLNLAWTPFVFPTYGSSLIRSTLNSTTSSPVKISWSNMWHSMGRSSWQDTFSNVTVISPTRDGNLISTSVASDKKATICCGQWWHNSYRLDPLVH